MSDQVIEIGTLLYNNRQRKIYEVFGKVSHCETEEWEILYRCPEWDLGVFRRRPESDFFELNRDGLPRFVVTPGWCSNHEINLWIDGYQSGLRFPPVDPNPDTQYKLDHEPPKYEAFKVGYATGKQHLQALINAQTKTSQAYSIASLDRDNASS